MCEKIYYARCLFSRCFYDLFLPHPTPVPVLCSWCESNKLRGSAILQASEYPIRRFVTAFLSLSCCTHIRTLERRENMLEWAKCVPVYTTWDCCESLVAYLKRKGRKKKRFVFVKALCIWMAGNVKPRRGTKEDHKIQFHCLVLNQVFWARVSAINSVVWITTQNNKSKKNVDRNGELGGNLSLAVLNKQPGVAFFKKKTCTGELTFTLSSCQHKG